MAEKKKNILVLVESPTKTTHVQEFLEAAYPEDKFTVLASGGHITKIPNRGVDRLGIDLDTMTPEFVQDRSKSKMINAIKKAGKKADLIILASDPDREGESIAWHLGQLFKDSGIEIRRMTFDEITAEAVDNAFKHLRNVDQNLVQAQFSRQMLDKIIGFLISGVLQKATGLMSAGRVQTPALKLLVDRDKEIKAFVPTDYNAISVVDNKKNISLDLNKDDKGIIPNKQDTYFLTNDKTKELIGKLSEEYKCIDYKSTKFETRSFKPYSTAGMLQDGYTKLRLSAPQVTMAAQRLYENGLITYIRTDSQRYSSEFIGQGKAYISKNYKPELFALPIFGKGKSDKVQDAHESIRPTDINKAPWKITIQDELQKRLYGLIWWNTLKSMMHGPSGNNHRWTFDNNGYEFKQSWQEVLDKGYNGITKDNSDEDIEVDDNDEIIVEKDINKPDLEFNKSFTISLPKSDIVTEAKSTMPPKMFNQASLIRTLKDMGIGRPSTYTPILSKLQDRGYVRYRKAKPILVEEKGYIATDYLYAEFAKLFNFDYTAKMEETLDKIADGNFDYVSWLKEIYKRLKDQTTTAKAEAVESGDICPKCGKGHLVFIKSYFNRGRGCSNFPITGCSYREYEQPDGTWKEYVEPTPEEKAKKKKEREERQKAYEAKYGKRKKRYSRKRTTKKTK